MNSCLSGISDGTLAVMQSALADDIAGRTMLKRAATRRGRRYVAAFAASDHARALTATALNVTAGSVVD
jgi:3-oxoacyl-[acyl-carrier protein] reductase